MEKRALCLHRIFVIFCWIIGGLSLLFAVIPMWYGIFRAGVAGLSIFGGLMLAVSFWNPPSDGWQKTARRLLIVALALFMGAGAIISAFMIHAAWLTPPDANQPATVVVLGCQAKNGKPSLMLRRRIDIAAEYLLAHPNTPVIATGGLDAPNERLTEAQVIEQELIARGIAPERIYRDDNSTNTRENIAFAVDIQQANMLPASFIIATDAFHQLRGRLYTQKNNLPASGLPCKTSWGLVPSYWVREWFGIMKIVILEHD